MFSMELRLVFAPRRPASRAPSPWSKTAMSLPEIDPFISLAVMGATAATDAVYVMFTNAVVRRRRLPAASWSSIWYLLSSFAVINYTHHWTYVVFAAAGSFIGAYASISFLHPGATYPTQPPGSSPL
jgi:uncharacterized membrane protein YhaH (DUF805 family)